VLNEDNPVEAKVEKQKALLSFSNVNEGKSNKNKHKNLKKEMPLHGHHSYYRPGE
jgi:predicted transcriptional regulator